MLPKVACVVLCFNGIDLTRQCLQSIQAQNYSTLEIFVVDNLSSDNTVALLRSEFSEVTVIEAGANLGYVGGNNLGIKAALANGAEMIFLINNDTLLSPTCVSSLIKTAEENHNIGVLGPMVYNWDDAPLISSAGGVIDWKHADAINEGMGETDQGQYLARNVDFINGCGLMLRREAIQQVGMLDERYFMYWEETDWCTRIKRAGWQVRFEPAAHMRHKAPIQSNQLSPGTLYYMTRNRLLFFAIHTRWPQKALTLAHAIHGMWQGIRRARQVGDFVTLRAIQAAEFDAIRQKWGRATW